MRTVELDRQIVPAVYARLVLDAASTHGVTAERLLHAAEVTADALDDPSERVSVLDMAALVRHAIDLTGEPGLGYEIALESSLMSHGIMGFGMLTSSSVRDAIELGLAFLGLRVPVLSGHLRIDGGTAAISVVETAPLGELRSTLFDLFLVKLARLGATLTERRLGFDDVEIWVDYPEPDYHARWADRLPPMSFDRGANELRFPSEILDLRLDTADAANARLVEEQCRREALDLDIAPDVVGRVRGALDSRVDGYPTLTEVADSLNMSSRTLKRRLQEHGTSFNRLLDTSRRAEASRLLTTTALPVEGVGRRLGYADARSFRRAFIAWTGSTPSDFRARHRRA